MAQVSHMAE